MRVMTLPEVTLQPGVEDFLLRHNAEAAFLQVRDLALELFEEVESIEVELLDDPDMNGRAWAVLHFTMPAGYPRDRLHAQHDIYYERLVREIPLSHCPLFGLKIHVAKD